MIETNKFARRPFYVDAVQVTAQNMQDVAQWCMGTIQNDGAQETVKFVDGVPQPAAPNKPDASGNYIKVRVHRPLTERQTKAFVGDWVLYAGTGFKVYTPSAFEKSFEQVSVESVLQAPIDPDLNDKLKKESGVPTPDQMVAHSDRA